MWIILLIISAVCFMPTEGLCECGVQSKGEEYAECTINDTKCELDFIPPISRFITQIELDGQPIKQLPHSAFHNLTNIRNIKTIILPNCQISYMHGDAFLNLENLTYLCLSFNAINEIHNETFQRVKQIEHIDMKSNHIEILKEGLFKNLIYLVKVQLAGNKIHHIESNTFQNVPSLKYVSLQNNKLQYVDFSFTGTLNSVTELYLYGNPWNCNCNLRELYHFFKKLEPNLTKTQSPKCANPLAIRGQDWRTEFMCNPQIISPSNENRTVTVGSVTTLSCLVHGYPKPDIKWQNGSRVIDTDLLSNTSNTYIHYVNYTFIAQRYDAGVYFCNVVNNTLQAYVNIKVQNVNIPWTFLLVIVLVPIAIIIIGIGMKCILPKSDTKNQVKFPALLKRLSLWRGREQSIENGISESVLPERTNEESVIEPILQHTRTYHQYQIREALEN